MMGIFNKSVAAPLVGLAFLAGSATAYADNYPSRAVTVVVPFLAGGGGDTLARVATHSLSNELGQTIVVENKPGAGGNLGTAQVARSAPDGYTLAYGTNGTAAINHLIYKNPGFSQDDLEPISRLTTIAAAMAVNADSPIKSVQDLIAAAKQKPGALTCGSAGNGTTSHIACEMFKQMAGVNVMHVPYRGGAAALTDLLGGRIDFMIDVMPNLAGQIAGGKLRPLAVTMKERVPSHPDIPTMIEAGVPDYYFFAWDGLYAPKGTPAPVLDKLNQSVRAALAKPDVVKSLTDRGATPAPTSREELREFIKSEYNRLESVVKVAGAQVD